MRRLLVCVLFAAVAATASAQAPATAPRFVWKKDAVLNYRVEHVTTAAEVVGDSKSDTKSIVKVVRRWKVTDVDAAGVAAVQMSLTGMQQERTTPSGEKLTFDSAAPDKGSPEFKNALSKYLNTPLATVKIDDAGKVADVKDAISDPTSFENELPFFIHLPSSTKVGTAYERNYKITLAPPIGTGEKYDAVQKCAVKSADANWMVVTVATELKNPPKAAADVIPLWQHLPQGEVVFDLKNGRLHSAKFVISKEIKDHAGEKSSNKFDCTMSVEYVEAK